VRPLTEIRRLDPVADHVRIVHLDACYEFPWDTTRSLELALFRTFAVPSIGELLASTGEFVGRPRKRYDDTDLLISSFAEAGYDSEEGRRAIGRMNRIHARFGIANEDFLYVLSTFVFEPIRWNARFGWRPLVEVERQATFHFWREVGRRMAIRDLPGSYQAFERFNVDFERERFGYSEGGRRVADATLRMFSRGVPGVRRAICAVLDEPLLGALRLERPSAGERRVAAAALHARSRVVRRLPPRRHPRLRTMRRTRSYPSGWTIEQLGSPPAP
jgi:hypothetical protein